ncbi:hypothetical protein NLU13_9849 [Sarocladium strictum]|uniref:Uncharacterized protein n=1 Tax=Sarocladium strictum TaxID=5046 RepID=A0AA39G9S5_SARSR|nr:hypothetical protein NLU13_9849 [Sarocladium strictum]
MNSFPHSSPDPLSDSTPYTQDEEAMDSLLQEIKLPISESPPTAAPSRHFTTAAEDLSAPQLGQGFQYQAKPPNRPGQFTARAIQPVLSAEPSTSKPELIAVGTIGTRDESRRPLNEPLLLPELVFSPPPQKLNQISHHFNPTKSLSRSGSRVGNAAFPRSPHDVKSSRPGQITVKCLGQDQAPLVKALDSQVFVGSTPSLESPMAAFKQSSPFSGLLHKSSRHQASLRGVDRGIPLKVAPHMLRRSNVHRSSSPTSACGDLEKPTRRLKHRQATESPCHILSRPLSRGDSRHSHTDEHTRSQSRASNVSKKRSALQKQTQQKRSQRRPDRKTMMQEMASQWNEYLLAADRDKEEYRLEIEGLQHDIDAQVVELETARRRLQEKDEFLTKLQGTCDEMQKSQDAASTERRQLNEQVASLREELNVAKGQTDAVKERNSACRKKVNEAITEHQSLFKLTKSYCSDLQQELVAEQNERTEQAKEVAQALQKSIAQRKAMKEFASFVEKEMTARESLKNETISALQSRISEQQQTLFKVSYLEKSLKTQLQAQHATQNSVSELHATLENFRRTYDRDLDERTLLAAAVQGVDDRVEAFSDRVREDLVNTLTKQEAEALFKSMQDSLTSSMRDLIIAATQGKESTDERLETMEDLLRTKLDSLKQELKEQVAEISCSATSSESFNERTNERFDRLEADLHNARTTTEAIEKRLCTMTAEGEMNALVANSKLDDTLKKLEKRDAKLGELRRQLQLVTEDYHAKLDAMRRKAEEEEASLQLNAQDFANQADEMSKAFEAQLDFALAQQREECEIAMRKEQTEHWTAVNSLQEAKGKLQKLAMDDEEKQVLQEKARSNEAQVLDLRECINRQEQQMETHKELERRWRQDIEAVDKIRAQLKSISVQLPHLEIMGSGLDKFAMIHDNLSSTAQYLAVEQAWVKGQLQSKTSGPGEVPARSELAAEASLDGWKDASSSLGTSQKDLDRRRVIVRSPSGSMRSPSPSLSVHQERKRRRAGFETQSILRLTATASDAQHLQAQAQVISEESKQPSKGLFDLMKGHSRYFRPIMSTAPLAVPSANSGIIEQIRAGLTQDRSSSWSLPTLADFERPQQTQPASEVDKPTEGAVAKRIKLEL